MITDCQHSFSFGQWPFLSQRSAVCHALLVRFGRLLVWTRASSYFTLGPWTCTISLRSKNDQLFHRLQFSPFTFSFHMLPSLHTLAAIKVRKVSHASHDLRSSQET